MIISAGFDAHRRDPLGNLNFVEADFAWATQKLMGVARKHAHERVVSVLEGGYDLEGLVALSRRACDGADGGVSRGHPSARLRRQARRNDRRRLATRTIPTNPSPIIAQVEASGTCAIGEFASMAVLGVVSNP